MKKFTIAVENLKIQYKNHINLIDYFIDNYKENFKNNKKYNYILYPEYVRSNSRMENYNRYLKRKFNNKKIVECLNFLNILLDEYDRFSEIIINNLSNNEINVKNKNNRKRKVKRKNNILIDKKNSNGKGGIYCTKRWLKWESNSCRLDSFMTLYLFEINPFIDNKLNDNYFNDKLKLKKLDECVRILENEPENEIKMKFWQYIDSLRLDGDNKKKVA